MAATNSETNEQAAMESHCESCDIAFEKKHNAIVASHRLESRLLRLLLWRNGGNSALALFSLLALAVACICHSVISVISMIGIMVMSATLGYCGYVLLLQYTQRTRIVGHPFKHWLHMDYSIHPHMVEYLAKCSCIYFNSLVNRLLGLVLVEKPLESFKLLLAFVLLNLVGGLMNGLTLLVFVILAMFILPKTYECNQGYIDAKLKSCGTLWQRMTQRYYLSRKKPSVPLNTPSPYSNGYHVDNFGESIETDYPKYGYYRRNGEYFRVK